MRQPILAGTGVAIALAFAGAAGADTINVHNTHDHGNGSLRKAVQDSAPGDTIKVPKGHYELTSGEIYIGNPLTIKGAGARKTIVDANGESRVFEIDYGPGTVKFQGLTIREGNTIEGSDSGKGGGVAAAPPTKVVLSKVAVLNNRTTDDVTFWNGGGAYVAGDLVIKQSLFADNHGYNGGAAATSSTGMITARDSTFFNNFGGNPMQNGEGGAFDYAVTLVDSTVVGNKCFNGNDCAGGVYGSDATLKGTIIAENTAYEPNGMEPGSPGNPGVGDNCGDSTPLSEGHNLSDLFECDLDGPGDIEGEPAKVGDLKNNGGPTNTLALAAASAAVNAGAAHCTSRDQRGVSRPQGPRCDIGAFERK